MTNLINQSVRIFTIFIPVADLCFFHHLNSEGENYVMRRECE
jgi:hypothetical protein